VARRRRAASLDVQTINNVFLLFDRVGILLRSFGVRRRTVKTKQPENDPSTDGIDQLPLPSINIRNQLATLPLLMAPGFVHLFPGRRPLPVGGALNCSKDRIVLLSFCLFQRELTGDSSPVTFSLLRIPTFDSIIRPTPTDWSDPCPWAIRSVIFSKQKSNKILEKIHR
jgi:hypothetical protein